MVHFPNAQMCFTVSGLTLTPHWHQPNNNDNYKLKYVMYYNKIEKKINEKTATT